MVVRGGIRSSVFLLSSSGDVCGVYIVSYGMGFEE